jgi:hypothetical protein
MGRPKGMSAPYAWKYKDLLTHQRHRCFLLSRAQANFRGEGWLMDLDDYCMLWTPELWPQRGRQSDALCMVRIDTDKPWSRDNCKIVTRYWQIARGKKSRQKGRGERQI